MARMMVCTGCWGAARLACGAALVLTFVLMAASPAAALVGGPHNPASSSIVQQVQFGTHVVTMRLSKVLLRGPDFDLRAQRPDGSYQSPAIPGERSFLGSVDEHPDAVASGVVMGDGTLWGQIIFDRGATWWTRGSNVSDTRGLGAAAFHWPTRRNLDSGMAGSTAYRWEMGLDMASDWYLNDAGASVSTAFELVEYSVSNIRAIYLQDALLMPALGRVVLRTSAARDPYDGLTTNLQRLETVEAEWEANQRDAVTDSAHVVTSVAGGGLARVSNFDPGSNYAASGASSDGTFDLVARHEAGHNWGPFDNHSSSAEGATVMEGNSFARFGGPELYALLLSRNERLGILDDMGRFSTAPVAPYAGLDLIDAVAGTLEVPIDVLANDHDANGEPLVLLNADGTSADGGTVTVRADGRTLLYRPPPALGGSEPDRFTYRIADSSGATATGVVLARHGRPFFHGEAEDAALSVGVTKGSDRRYYSGSGFAALGSGPGRFVEWTLDMPVERDVTLVFQYDSDAQEELEVRVNGELIAAAHPFPIDTSSSWVAGAPLVVHLPAGRALVRVTTPATGGPRIDYLRATWADARPHLNPLFAVPHAAARSAFSASIASAATDTDAGDRLTFARLAGPSWLSVGADGSLSGTPTDGEVGSTTVRVRVADPSGLVDEASYAVVVDPIPPRRCPTASGAARGTSLGPVRLHRRRATQRKALPTMTRAKTGIDSTCLAGGGSLRAVYPTRKLTRRLKKSVSKLVRDRAVLLLSSSRRQSVARIKPRDRQSLMRRRLRGERRYVVGRTAWFFADAERVRLIYSVRNGRVREVGIADLRVTRGRAAQKRFLRAWQLG